MLSWFCMVIPSAHDFLIIAKHLDHQNFTCHPFLEHRQIMQENTASVHYRKSWNAQSSLPSALTSLRWTVCKNVSRHNVEMHATPPWQRQHNQWSQLGGSRCERGEPSGAISPRFTPCTLHQTRGFFSFYSFVLHFIWFFDTSKVWLSDCYDESPFQRANTLSKSYLEQDLINLKLWSVQPLNF